MTYVKEITAVEEIGEQKLEKNIYPKMTRLYFLLNQIFLLAIMAACQLMYDNMPSWDFSVAEILFSPWGIISMLLIACFVYDIIIIHLRLLNMGYNIVISWAIAILPAPVIMALGYIVYDPLILFLSFPIVGIILIILCVWPSKKQYLTV